MNEYEEELSLTIQLRINWNKCVIFQKDGPTTYFTDKSWETLKNGANNWQDDILLKNLEVSTIECVMQATLTKVI